MKKHLTFAEQKGAAQARLITRQRAKTFYFASRLLDREHAAAAHVVYAICRACDDSVDSPGRQSSSQRLEKINTSITRAYGQRRLSSPLLQAFRATIRRYNIPQRFFSSLLRGMSWDLEPRCYETYNELRQYCYLSAGVVGQIMLCILDPGNAAAEPYAVRLGIAMQLTNIIRDVGEDLRQGRIYIPAEDLRRFSLSTDTLAAAAPSRQQALLKFQIARARGEYARAEPGLGLIRRRRNRLAVCAMHTLYAAILTMVERNRYDVLTKRAFVSLPQKLLLVPAVLTRALRS